MASLVAYVGTREAQAILVDCLKKLAYRGYDSCGFVIVGKLPQVFKGAVRIDWLIKDMLPADGKIGLAHTRWATHGGPSEVNAHPHWDCDRAIFVVHNGIINNYLPIKRELISQGHQYRSETDTEVIPHLIEKYYGGDLKETVRLTLHVIEGSFAIAVLHKSSAELVVAKRQSSLLIGLGDGENFISSDAAALLEYTDRFINLEDDDIAVVTPSEVRISHNGKSVERKERRVPWSVKDAQKGGYEHFMLKEIHEQPDVILRTVREGIEPVDLADNIFILGSGSSFHSSLVGQEAFRKLARIPTHAVTASECLEPSDLIPPTLIPKTLSIAITQSGETADTLRAVKRLRDEGCRVIAITNVMSSTVSRIADHTIFTRAGPEISVAATKSFTAQLVVLYLLALSGSQVSLQTRDALLAELAALPTKVQAVLDRSEAIAECARYLAKYDNVFCIARAVGYPVALEGAVKLKEIAYIHAEAYPAGELKHGPFAVLSPSTPVIAILSKDNTYEAMLTNIKEARARGVPCIVIATDEEEANVSPLSDWFIAVPKAEAIFSPIANSVVLQLLSYYAARERGCSIDFPRNFRLSISDTVASTFARPSVLSPPSVSEVLLPESELQGHQLVRELLAVPPGQSHWKEYQRACKSVLEFCLAPPLSKALEEETTESGLHRRDLIFQIPFDATGVWGYVRLTHQAVAMVVDAKNYSEYLPKDQIVITSKYFGEKKSGNFGLIISRKGTEPSGRREQMDRWVHHNEMIICLDDNDLINMVRLKLRGEKPESIIEAQIYQIRQGI